jgi:HlyD family type I secretion membrane fusion protein
MSVALHPGSALVPHDGRRAPPSQIGPRGFRGPIAAGLIILAVFVGGFGTWATLAPLSTAAVAPGMVVVDTKRKVIQHLEPGIVREILVRDDDRVTAGQVLIRLDNAQVAAKVQALVARYNGALALAARLRAEELGRAEIEFPPELLAEARDPDVAKLVDSEIGIFKAKLAEYQSQAKVLAQRDAQIGEEIKGLQGQIAAQDSQLGLIAEEIKVVREMLERGLAQRPRLLLLMRQAAELEGQRSQNVAAIARARQTIGDTELRISELHTSRIDDAVEQYGDNQKELFDLAEQLRAAKDVLDRIEIRSPMDGIVVNRSVHTPGGVINAGEPLMEIVPSIDRLVVESHVEVNDIGKVGPGLPAQIRFTAYSQRTTPTIDGRVLWVSADRLEDPKTKQPYYLARIEMDEAQLAKLDNVRLYAGMPADTMIVTAQRTALDYLLTPIERTFSRGMREK